MLMVGLMIAGIALTFARHHAVGVALIAIATAVKATAGLALPFMVWVWMRHLRSRNDRSLSAPAAFAAAAAASIGIFLAVFAVLSLLAGVGLGWLTALAGSVKIINWLTIPTAVANLTNAIGGWFVPVNFYAVLEISRIVGIGIIAVSLPVLWWRFRHDDREALLGIAWAMAVVVLFVPAALPWYYTWPLAVASALAQSRSSIALIAGFSTWIGDLQARRVTWDVLVDPRSAGHGVRSGGVVRVAPRGRARTSVGPSLSARACARLNISRAWCA